MSQIGAFSEGINTLTVSWSCGGTQEPNPLLTSPVLQSMLEDDLFQTSPPEGATPDAHEVGV